MKKLTELSFNADMYFILETRKQYTKGFDLTTSLVVVTEVKPIAVKQKSITYTDFVKHFRLTNNKGVVEWGDNCNTKQKEWISIIEASYKLFKTTWVNISEAKAMIDNYGDEYELINIQIKKLFITGKTYTRREVKDILQQLYDAEDLKRKAKHTDLDEIMTVKQWLK